MRILHRVGIVDAAAHLIEIETTISDEAPLPDPLVLFLPVWTPGSYLVREYSRHVEGFACEAHPVTKIRKNAWEVRASAAREVTVRYRVYCAELTVRTNHVDATHLYLNGAPTFVALSGRLDAPVEVELAVPEGWRVATSLEAASERRFRAKDYDTLVDCPIEAGLHREASVDILGRKHKFAIWSAHGAAETRPASAWDLDIARLLDATKAIVEAEARLFGGVLPHEGYQFLVHLAARGRGGLEHMTSSSLIAADTCFDTRESWLDLLSLIAHEYFHLWNVKRMRPAGLSPYRYEEENYTRLLWWFEGATSYYDWRSVRLAKQCTAAEYLDHLASEIAYVESTPGRLVHALESASFDAWIKLYRPDENSPNSTISYYRKGELVCGLLDLELRARTQGRSSLDAVLLHAWNTCGARGKPVPEDGMQRLFEEATGLQLGDLFDAWIRGTRDLDVDATLRHVGLAVERQPRGEAKCGLGVRTRADGARLYVASVLRGSAAQRAGLDAGDEIVALGDKRVEASLDAVLAGKRPGDSTTLLVCRDGLLRTLPVVLDPPRLDKIRLAAAKDATPEQNALRAAWLGE